MNASLADGLMTAAVWLPAAGFSSLVLVLLFRLRAFTKAPNRIDPQHIHVAPTSRLGGLAVFIGFVAAAELARNVDIVASHQIWPLIISALPVILVGLWEDVTHRASARTRLFAAVVSAALASTIAGGVIPRLDLPLLDRWLTILPFAIPLTWFMVAGACNAFNIIDGTNGLAGGSALLAFVGIAAAAIHVGDLSIGAIAVAMSGALVGFLLWNYPKGKVFLGDGGAYFTGFVYAQLAIQLISRNPEISAWFVIALAAYPIIETVFSIVRRAMRNRSDVMQPDAKHLHSLLYLHFLDTATRPPVVERRLLRAEVPYPGVERRQPPERRANARVAPRLWMHGVLCLFVALLCFDKTLILIGFTFVYAIVYISAYRDAERLNQDASVPSRTIVSDGH